MDGTNVRFPSQGRSNAKMSPSGRKAALALGIEPAGWRPKGAPSKTKSPALGPTRRNAQSTDLNVCASTPIF